MADENGKKDFIADIRKRMGGVNDSVISDECIETAIDSALEEMTRIVPACVYKSLILVRGKEEYDVDEDVVTILDLWLTFHSYNAFALNLDAQGYGVIDPEYADISVFHSPSLMNIIEQKWEQWNYRHGHEWEWNMDSRKIRLIPAPRSNGKAVYKASKVRTLDNVPVELLKPFKDLVIAESMSSKANEFTFLGGVTSMPIGIGNVTFSSQGLSDKAGKMREEALRKLYSAGGGAGTVVVVG